ncbi:hypothetical protein RRG08_011281 [Elysia crispata]|uniref:Uncharacterized protein n=1 Tax=Elysia crispata TaxID=231223 RepID=A0AAE0ZMR9_9GAST|nr:hypothetical protein RRG08_011281 [Elysia crispata]
MIDFLWCSGLIWYPRHSACNGGIIEVRSVQYRGSMKQTEGGAMCRLVWESREWADTGGHRACSLPEVSS